MSAFFEPLRNVAYAIENPSSGLVEWRSLSVKPPDRKRLTAKSELGGESVRGKQFVEHLVSPLVIGRG